MKRKRPPIRFNKPYLTGKESYYMFQAIEMGKISGNGEFTQKCQQFFNKRYGFRHSLLTNSCTDALEMAAILLNIREGDEVIMPSFNFVSAANAFLMRGAKIRFADSLPDHPNIDPESVRTLINNRTKAIVLVHYAGVACDMDALQSMVEGTRIALVEDTAHGIEAGFKGKQLGSFGSLATFSFHETKNIISGEGGLLVVNDPELVGRSEIIWEKGTNRAAFFRGDTEKYEWVDIGSSFLPSELTASFLYAQLENIGLIQDKRCRIWELYREHLQPCSDKGCFDLPRIPDYASNNGHMFYLVCQDPETRNELIDYLVGKGIHAVFHYLPLHNSPFFHNRYEGKGLPNAERLSECLLRLPFYFELSEIDVAVVCEAVNQFFKERG